MPASTNKLQTLFLYSVNTWLGYVIAQEYYRKEHYVWCCPYFDVRSNPGALPGPPPSHSPKEIYLQLAEEVVRGNKHSHKIAQAKVGILRAATAKKKADDITDAELQTIQQIVELAENRDFKPLLYVISYEQVKSMVSELDPREKAHPLSPEYLIERLPRFCFEVIDFSR